MKRRSFIKSGALASVATVGSVAPLLASQVSRTGPRLGEKFKLKFGPHFGMFENHAGKDLIDQLRFAADVGFTAWEDNGMKGRPVDVQEAIGNELEKLGMDMGVFVAHEISWNEPNLTNGDPDLREKFLKEVRESVDVAKRCNATWMTVVLGHVDLRLDMGYQTAHVIESLKQASAILEPHDLVMVLEPLNFYNHPGLFLTKIPQAFEICRSVGSPACKILDDLYHQQIQEGNLIPNIDKAYDEIGYFQIGDNPGRKEPTTGEINYKNVFKHINAKGFTGIYGMEHGNSKPGKEGELALIEAYRSVDLD
jgi:hydroxypyruvate isomerase